MFDMFLNNNNVMLLCGCIVIVIILYFLISWHIKQTVKNELKQICVANKKKKIIQEKKKQMSQSKLTQSRQSRQSQQPNENENEYQQQIDMDSYIDPAERCDVINDDQCDMCPPTGYSGIRLAHNDIGMRDIADGAR